MTYRGLLGLIFGILLGAVIAAGMCKAAETDPRSVPPRASFGVMRCGEVVAIWVVTQDGKVLRTDAEHHPDTPEEYNAFLKWLETAQEDIYVIPCPPGESKAS